MAHHAVEPMDIDGESEFDNKENTYNHSNVVSRTPCTEKGYEELDVSELNMKLRYSITPAASPMSKSMSHCVDNRYNASTDESLNNTVINENNLTRSLNSTLGKTDVSIRTLPLQALSSDLIDNRNSNVLRALDATITDKDVTITVNDGNELDCLSIPSSSSSLAHTPEATTPTKEIPKNDGGSPIMRGLKSVLSMFRTSQSPIPLSEADNNGNIPLDVAPINPELQAVSSTPVYQKSKEQSMSRRSSPQKESIVFNEDLEKELQWNDDSTIVFSTEKIPIHKLFFYDKPGSKTDEFPVKKEEAVANMSVEYMDVSYNEISVKDKTLDTNVNKTNINDVSESDGEFVDCETTFTQEDSKPKINEGKINNNVSIKQDVPECNVIKKEVKENLFMDTTQDIINLLDSTQFTGQEIEFEKQLDYSSADIVNRLSDLINASENENNMENMTQKDENKDVPESKVNENLKKVETAVQPLGNPVIDVENEVNINDNTTAENDANANKLQSIIVVPDILDSHRESSLIEPVPLGVQSLVTDELPPQLPKLDEIKLDVVTEMRNENEAMTVSPMNNPLPLEDNLDEINDNSVRFSPSFELQDKTVTSDETSNIVPMRSLENTIIESTSEKQISNTGDASSDIPCLPSVLSRDDSTPTIDNNDNLTRINTVSYEATTDPVLPRTETNVPDINNDVLPKTFQTPDIISNVDDSLRSESIEPNRDTANTSIVDNNPALVERVTEIEVSFIGQNKEQIQDTSAMDVSIICEPSPDKSVNIKEHNSISPVEEIQEKIVTAAGLSSNSIDKNDNDKEHSIALPVTITDEELISRNESETLKEIHTTTAEKLDTVGFDDSKTVVTALDCHSPVANGTITVSSVILAAERSNDTSNINTSCEIIADTINSLNVSTTARKSINEMRNEQCINASIVPELPEVTNTTEASSNVSVKETENITDTPNTLHGIEKPNKSDEKIDEEIVLSEGNSPFVSMSAEELVPEVKQCDIEEFDKEPATKEETYVPPSSPKIVSKGYNFNFDDLDGMDPFATKSKIRMSPPPAISPNTPIHSINNTNNNRRKTMPAKKNVSKAKKSFNSTFDSAESDPSKLIKKSIVNEATDNNKNIEAHTNKPGPFNLINENQTNVAPLYAQSGTVDALKEIKAESKPSRESNLNKTTSMEYCNIVGATEHNVDENKTDCIKNTNLKFNDVLDATDVDNSQITSVESESSNDSCTEFKNIAEGNESDVKDQKADSNQNTTAVLNDIVANTDQSITENKHVESDYNKDITLDVKDIVSKPLKTSTMIGDIAMSDSCKASMKSDNASSSEQSTYYSAGASSTEFEPKNVFNLPEIDDKDFNPFATKSKICKTPPPDLDIVDPFATKCNMKSSPEASLAPQKDANITVIMDNSSTKEAPYDVSTCSSASDDKDITVQEVHTEDEDTIEGPFLEADDVHECEKMSNFIADEEKGNMGDFDNRNELADDNEMFIDAEAFEFLMNQNKADEVAYSGKESLFLKFDPLFARRLTSDGVASALSELKRRQSTPKRAPKEKELISFDRLSAGPSDLNNKCPAQTPVENQDDINVAMSKPMMVVPPAVNPVVIPKKCVTPSRANRLSMTFTSPAMAVIDRLLSLSSSSPSAGLDTTVTHVSREHNEADQALTQLRELLAEKEINVYNLRSESRELKDRLSTLETQMKSLEAESEERLKKINELTENLTDKTKTNKNMAKVVEEYERTIASLISETEQDKKRYAEERNQLIRERDEQTTHLASMEVSFSDLHSKYEKSKQVIMGYKSNEDAYKNSLKELEDNLSKMHTNYELLKQHATSKLNHANQELEKLNKAHEGEVLKFNAMIKRKDLHITSLEESLAQKTKANEELTAICDELINKVG